MTNQKQVYDQYGHETGDQMNQQGGGGMPAGFGRGGFGAGGEINPEDLFNMFFQGAAGPQFRAQFGRAGGQRGGGFSFNGGGNPFGQQQRERGPREGGQGQQESHGFFGQFMQLLPVIICLLISFSSYGSQTAEPIYSLRPQGNYQTQIKTGAKGLVPDIPFYVKSANEFEKTYRKATNNRYNLERDVVSEYKKDLYGQCEKEKTKRRNRIYQARLSGNSDKYTEAQQMATPSCDKYQMFVR